MNLANSGELLEVSGMPSSRRSSRPASASRGSGAGAGASTGGTSYTPSGPSGVPVRPTGSSVSPGSSSPTNSGTFYSPPAGSSVNLARETGTVIGSTLAPTPTTPNPIPSVVINNNPYGGGGGGGNSNDSSSSEEEPAGDEYVVVEDTDSDTELDGNADFTGLANGSEKKYNYTPSDEDIKNTEKAMQAIQEARAAKAAETARTGCKRPSLPEWLAKKKWNAYRDCMDANAKAKTPPPTYTPPGPPYTPPKHFLQTTTGKVTLVVGVLVLTAGGIWAYKKLVK